MNRTAKLSGVLASLGMAAGLLLTPAAASAEAETALTTLATPAVLTLDVGSHARNTPGTTTLAIPRPGVSVNGGSWSGSVQFSDGSSTNFCPSQTVGLNSRLVKKLTVLASKASWCP
ncbi:hypothetical protein [Streptosporangium sp. V21-05]|uniref:hypothetical protein n=1 Tax=Streptosporangium sp. V21-05 TaxID=3446115 RepID=UPI003F53C008